MTSTKPFPEKCRYHPDGLIANQVHWRWNKAPGRTGGGRWVCRSFSQDSAVKSRDRRAKFLAEYKLAKGCADCGYNAHSEALDFDHLPGTKKLFNIGYGKDHLLEAILAEIAKCEVVCANCHRVRTSHRRPWLAKGLQPPAEPLIEIT
jgi:hypothetical protein